MDKGPRVVGPFSRKTVQIIAFSSHCSQEINQQPSTSSISSIIIIIIIIIINPPNETHDNRICRFWCMEMSSRGGVLTSVAARRPRRPPIESRGRHSSTPIVTGSTMDSSVSEGYGGRSRRMYHFRTEFNYQCLFFWGVGGVGVLLVETLVTPHPTPELKRKNAS